MKTVTIRNITDILDEEFGEWWDNPYVLNIFAYQMQIFDEEKIKTECPFSTIDACLEFKRKRTVNGKPINEQFNQRAFEKLIQREEYEI